MSTQPQDHQPQQPQWSQQPGQSTPSYRPAGVPYPGAPPSYQTVAMSPADQRTWAIAAHLSGFLAAFVALSFLGPLIIYLVLKDRGAFIRQHSAEALNFQLTMWIGLLISSPLMLVGIGFLTAAAIAVAMLVFQILGAVAAGGGRDYHYPLAIHFVS